VLSGIENSFVERERDKRAENQIAPVATVSDNEATSSLEILVTRVG